MVVYCWHAEASGCCERSGAVKGRLGKDSGSRVRCFHPTTLPRSFPLGGQSTKGRPYTLPSQGECHLAFQHRRSQLGSGGKSGL